MPTHNNTVVADFPRNRRKRRAWKTSQRGICCPILRQLCSRIVFSVRGKTSGLAGCRPEGLRKAEGARAPSGTRSCTYKWAASRRPRAATYVPGFPHFHGPRLPLRKPCGFPRGSGPRPAVINRPQRTGANRLQPTRVAAQRCRVAGRAGLPEPPGGFSLPSEHLAAERRSRPRGGRSTRPSMSQDARDNTRGRGSGDYFAMQRKRVFRKW
jgi:hypothetical protein